MPTNRIFFRYHFKLGNRFVCTGITYDIDWREAEHQDEPGWEKGHIVQVGDRTNVDVAIAWALAQEAKGKPVRREWEEEEAEG